MTTDQKMPRPWFTASSHNFSMATILHVDGSLGREGPLHEGERRLGWFVLPPFQRPPVWTRAQQIRFIESAWGGLPLGSWVYNRTPSMDGVQDGWLLDGQQRHHVANGTSPLGGSGGNLAARAAR